MKKVLFFILLSIIMEAQTNRFIYDYQIKRNGNYDKMYLVLDVNPTQTKFYDYKFIEMDSLSRKTPGHNYHTDSPSEQVLFRPKNSSANTRLVSNNAGDYFAIKSIDEMKWKLGKETKIIDGYKLQKATTIFGGRNWTAWFSKDVNIAEGPYKFRGLPGLIFEVEDQEKNFIYKLVKNKKLSGTYDTTNFLETYYGKKPLFITYQQFVKLKLDDYENLFANLTTVLKNGGTINMNGENIMSITQLEQRRKGQQESIRRFYNPIELDKAIPYPTK